jgi:hypothetical protein
MDISGFTADTSLRKTRGSYPSAALKVTALHNNGLFHKCSRMFLAGRTNHPSFGAALTDKGFSVARGVILNLVVSTAGEYVKLTRPHSNRSNGVNGVNGAASYECRLGDSQYRLTEKFFVRAYMTEELSFLVTKCPPTTTTEAG